MNYRFLPAAENDLVESTDYYEHWQNGLGTDFSMEVHHAVIRILEHPQAWTSISKICRRCLVNRFPYGIIYSVEGNEILILAVMNLHRNPKNMKDRISV
ncbi:MAG: type II toxin-antitoxin system RelE/ParE family toxin [Victivallales bacterium]|jgi:plasmid stabilization system protein ParE